MEMNIAMYKGGLHKIIGVPRRWPLQKPNMSLATFKRLQEKRALALQRISQGKEEGGEDEGENPRKRKRDLPEDDEGLPAKQACVEKVDGFVSGENYQEETKPSEQQAPTQMEVVDDHQHEAHEPPLLVHDELAQNVVNVQDERVKKRAELEQKLESLRAEKHRLVQLLKQILMDEEESRKRAQSTPVMQTPVQPPQAHVRPAELEEGELDCARTPSPQPRTLPHATVQASV